MALRSIGEDKGFMLWLKGAAWSIARRVWPGTDVTVHCTSDIYSLTVGIEARDATGRGLANIVLTDEYLRSTDTPQIADGLEAAMRGERGRAARRGRG